MTVKVVCKCKHCSIHSPVATEYCATCILEACDVERAWKHRDEQLEEMQINSERYDNDED